MAVERPCVAALRVLVGCGAVEQVPVVAAAAMEFDVVHGPDRRASMEECRPPV
jgi:hypothetical protein